MPTSVGGEYNDLGLIHSVELNINKTLWGEKKNIQR